MNYVTPEEAYGVYKNKKAILTLREPYRLVGFEGQWEFDPEYRAYCDQIDASTKRLLEQGNDKLDVYMDLLKDSVENNFIAKRLLHYIAREGVTTKIPLVNTGWSIGVSPNFYIREGISITLEELWGYYYNEANRFHRKIRIGPFSRYTIDITWKLGPTYERVLIIALNKPGGWIVSFF
jgi:hypothetical protein